MRIIGGKNKGKKISLPIDKYTRPLRDLVKESIFNLIEHSNKFSVSILNSIVLDLFSGTGSFGLECFSRGAKFIEKHFTLNKTSQVIRDHTLSATPDEFKILSSIGRELQKLSDK